MRYQAQIKDEAKNTRHYFLTEAKTEEEARERVFKVFKHKVKRQYVEKMVLITLN